MYTTHATGNVELHQSAHRRGHSMETTLLKVKTDLLKAMDNKMVTCLALLYLSVAFDMVSHDLLLNWLKTDLVSLAPYSNGFITTSHVETMCCHWVFKRCSYV